ncbi:MAG: response regulator transcription factor [Lachnospiraceae bacterium]|nr:response regulator transcription factor [Lachnospiraceae bacterium]
MDRDETERKEAGENRAGRTYIDKNGKQKEGSLLLVEDDEEICQMFGGFLEAEHYEVTCAADGEEALRKFGEGDWDLVLLDLRLPKRSGLEVLQCIRKVSTVPVLILSAKDTDSDKTLGLSLGADDYVTKPFSVTEVLARIKANIRRSTEYIASRPSDVASKTSTGDSERIFSDREWEESLTWGTLVLDQETYSVRKGGEVIKLTVKEFEILRLLLKNPKKVYTKAQLYAQVWQEEFLADENAIQVHISRLRNKIEDDPKNPRCIVTVWGIGYRLGAGR